MSSWILVEITWSLTRSSTSSWVKQDCSRNSWYSCSVLKFWSFVVWNSSSTSRSEASTPLLLGLAQDPGLVEDVVQRLVAQGRVLRILGAGALAVLGRALTGGGLAQGEVEVLLADLLAVDDGDGVAGGAVVAEAAGGGDQHDQQHQHGPEDDRDRPLVPAQPAHRGGSIAIRLIGR